MNTDTNYIIGLSTDPYKTRNDNQNYNYINFYVKKSRRPAKQFFSTNRYK